MNKSTPLHSVHPDHQVDFGGISKIFSGLWSSGAARAEKREEEQAQAQFAASHAEFDAMMALMLPQLQEALEDFDLEGDEAAEVVRNFSYRMNVLVEE